MGSRPDLQEQRRIAQHNVLLLPDAYWQCDGYWEGFTAQEWLVRGVGEASVGKQPIMGWSCQVCWLPVTEGKNKAVVSCMHQVIDKEFEILSHLGLEEVSDYLVSSPMINVSRSIT